MYLQCKGLFFYYYALIVVLFCVKTTLNLVLSHPVYISNYPGMIIKQNNDSRNQAITTCYNLQ